uniref:Uncharacterized protein n=1 Tax=Nelumbo nucifera TaxID=4432 RepID=A0A822XG82_NELNU|nr:TPA_asm: hypothetical protein HUJ06_020863 [Nelumbo nucifera]
MLGLGSDGVLSLVQLRTPPPAMMGLPNIPMSLGGYSYLVMKLGPLQLARKGLSVASTSACLTFTVCCYFLVFVHLCFCIAFDIFFCLQKKKYEFFSTLH